jgi:hypothetical protein
VEELLGAHEHALERIAAMYQFFQSFEIEHGKEMRALVDVTVCVASSKCNDIICCALTNCCRCA